MTTTVRPARESVSAAAQPDGPAPTTRTSTFVSPMGAEWVVDGSVDIARRLDAVRLGAEAGADFAWIKRPHHEVKRKPDSFRKGKEREWK